MSDSNEGRSDEPGESSGVDSLSRLFGGILVNIPGMEMPQRQPSGEASNITIHLSLTCRRGLRLALNLLDNAVEAWQSEEAFLVFRSYIDAEVPFNLRIFAQFNKLVVPLEDGMTAFLPTSLILSAVDDTGSARRRQESGELMIAPVMSEKDEEMLSDFLTKVAFPKETTKPYSFLADAFGASEDECILAQTLHLLLRVATMTAMVPLLKSMRSDPEGSLARFSGMSKERVDVALKQGNLCKIGLIIRQELPTILVGRTESLRNMGDTPYLDIHAGLDGALNNNPATADGFLSLLRGRKVEHPENPLAWSDFEHIGPLADMAANLLANVGGSVLLVGPPGSGKTEFALALARRLGRPAYSIGERDDAGKEPRRGERFASLKAAIAVSGDNPILLVEEAEDMLQVPMGATDRFGFSKGHLNRFLDEVKSPVIWTTNNTGGMDPATLRRMSMIIPFGDVSYSVRQRIWQRAIAREGAGLKDVDTSMLAREWNATAGLCATAIRTARDSDAGVKGINYVLDGFARVMDGLRSREDTDPPPFDSELCESTENLEETVRLLVKAGPTPWSMCLYGPPGTGKSAFARHISNAIGMEWLLMRASDLMDKYVGGTEKKIAEAFARARTERKVLVFDEADSLLASREGAQHSWERNQVNEMLTQMEYHTLPFFATTNLMEILDKSSLRRFTFKMEFKDLSSTKAYLAFERILGMPVPDGLLLPSNISPGDMAGLLKRKHILGVTDPAVLVRWLWQESEVKEGKRTNIGFGSA